MTAAGSDGERFENGDATSGGRQGFLMMLNGEERVTATTAWNKSDEPSGRNAIAFQRSTQLRGYEHRRVSSKAGLVADGDKGEP